MPHNDDRKKRRRKKRQPQRDPEYRSLLDEAIREGWTEEQYRQALYDSPKFAAEFPGYFREDGSAVFGSAEEYRSAYEEYSHIGAQYGQSISKQTFAEAVRSSVSPAEFADRMNVVDRINTLKATKPDEYANFTKQLGLSSTEDVLSFALGTTTPDLYDKYEALKLKAGGLSIGGKQAGEVAKLVGDSTGASDLSGTISEILALHPDVAPELKAAGISDADLVKAKNGIDPSGKVMNKVQQLVAQRRAFGRGSADANVVLTGAGTIGVRGNEGNLGSA